jgi:hypothetical protein
MNDLKGVESWTLIRRDKKKKKKAEVLLQNHQSDVEDYFGMFTGFVLTLFI